jgi:hypothetical protein
MRDPEDKEWVWSTDATGTKLGVNKWQKGNHWKVRGRAGSVRRQCAGRHGGLGRLGRCSCTAARRLPRYAFACSGKVASSPPEPTPHSLDTVTPPNNQATYHSTRALMFLEEWIGAAAT